MLTAIKRYNVDSIGLMTIVGTETFSHDAMGNPTSYGLKTLTWSGKQLTRYYYQPSRNLIYDYTYAYDENGLRTQKVINRVTTSYYYNGSVLMGMVTGSGNTAIHQFFSYDSSGNVVSVDYSSNGGGTFTTYYYLRNAQNDIVKIIDGRGNTVVQYTYDSWGKPISTTGSLSATLGANQPFRYRGYVYDAETGWYYLQSRYYDPTIVRFVSADVLLSTGQGVVGHNSYAYCGNNPIARTDSTGYAWWHWAIAAAVVAVAAVAVVATAGGAAAAVCAVTMVANGAAAATTASTVAAGVFIGSSVGFAAATMSSIATSGSVEDFMDNGDWYTVAGTMTGGLLGGVNAYNLRPRNYPRVVPQEAEDTYDYVQTHNGSPRFGYKGGRIYENDGRNGSQILPNDTQYREYDIYPLVKGVRRGIERIVIGANGSAWYTYDHYMNFIQFK